MAVMAERRAQVTWKGNLTEGSGTITGTGSGAFPQQLPVTWAARTERSDGKTSPEELIAMAHASCYAMAFSNTLNGDGHPPEELNISETVTLERTDAGPRVTRIDVEVRGKVPGLNQQEFQATADKAEQGCPISNLFRNNAQINVKATLQ